MPAKSAAMRFTRAPGLYSTSRERTHQVVLCHVSHDQHSAWGRGQRDRAPARRHIQVRLAHVPRVAEAYGFCRLSRPAWRARAFHILDNSGWQIVSIIFSTGTTTPVLIAPRP